MKNLDTLSKICPICNSKSRFIFTSKHNNDIYQCENYTCGHFFTPPKSLTQGICIRENLIEKESDEFLQIYDERNARLLDFLIGQLPKFSKKINLLDFGAGNAHISRTFKRILQNNATIYCLEPNLACHSLYIKNDLIQVKKISDLPHKEFDLIYMIEVIEHLIDPLETLSMLRSKLKDGGQIFISTPCGKASERETHAYDTSSHLHFFTEKSLNLTLTKSFFKPIVFNYIPQMYPLQSNTTKHVFYSGFKSLLKKLIPPLLYKPKINHLVGLTKLK